MTTQQLNTAPSRFAEQEPAGDWKLLEKVMEGANAPVDEAAEERKGGAGVFVCVCKCTRLTKECEAVGRLCVGVGGCMKVSRCLRVHLYSRRIWWGCVNPDKVPCFAF
jgi:hypothetical protein